jgi:DNA (cytosine-5)-methyltransferase 1
MGDLAMPQFYDFFAGAGLATLGLAPEWRCIWANDIDAKKAAAYRAGVARVMAKAYKRNFVGKHFVLGDVASIQAAHLPGPADLAWASFPCQDLSLAGWRRGLSAERSGTFWIFWRLMQELLERGRRPPLIVIENVTGLLHGDSFAGLCEAVAALDMQFGALVIDAKRFVPQSRPRVFVVCVDSRVDCSQFVSENPNPAWTPRSLQEARALLTGELDRRWRWWNLPEPSGQSLSISQIIERNPWGVTWQTAKETDRLLDLMSKTNRAKVEAAAASGRRQVGFLYKRMRNGVQRAEVRFDGVAGCLRTPRGGSSRQTVVIVEKGGVRTRLLSPREAARLMGVDDSFVLPAAYNDAYHAMGDGVVVPAVHWLSKHLLLPLSRHAKRTGSIEKKRWEHTPWQCEFQSTSEQRASEWLTSMQSRRVLPPG